jgi:hypothetical protein
MLAVLFAALKMRIGMWNSGNQEQKEFVGRSVWISHSRNHAHLAFFSTQCMGSF